MDPWRIFILLVSKKKDSMNSPIYKFLLSEYPVQFILKLLSMVPSDIDDHITEIIAEHFKDVLVPAYSNLEGRVLDRLKRKSIEFLMDSNYSVSRCGVCMSYYILKLTLQNKRNWLEFVWLATKAFGGHNVALENRVLNIFVQLPVVLKHNFMLRFKPYFSGQHLGRLEQLLVMGENENPYHILPCVSYMLPKRVWASLFELSVANAAEFLSRDVPRSEKCHVALALAYCVQHELNVRALSGSMQTNLENIIILLEEAGDPAMHTIAKKLYEALCQKLWYRN